MPVRDVAHMPAQYRHTCHTIVTFCHICHRINRSVDGCRAPRQMSRCTYTHREYPGMAWKFNIGGVFYVVIIPNLLRLK